MSSRVQRRHRCPTAWFLSLLLSATLVWADDESTDEEPQGPVWKDVVVVTASRLEQEQKDVAANVTVLERIDVEHSAALTVDDYLRQVPGFSLFRRSSSLVAHPTSQGASLRGIGPSGARGTGSPAPPCCAPG